MFTVFGIGPWVIEAVRRKRENNTKNHGTIDAIARTAGISPRR